MPTVTSISMADPGLELRGPEPPFFLPDCDAPEEKICIFPGIGAWSLKPLKSPQAGIKEEAPHTAISLFISPQAGASGSSGMLLGYPSGKALVSRASKREWGEDSAHDTQIP